MDSVREVAVGRAGADLAICGGQVFCAFTQEWLDSDVLVTGETVAAVVPRGDARASRATEQFDATGLFVSAGLIDAHVHIESSKLTPAGFASCVVPRGTTAIVAEPHEIGNVLGADGVTWFADACERVPLDVYMMVPSCVPASSFESPGGTIDAAQARALLDHPRAIGLGEMMNFPGVVANDAAINEMLAAAGTKHVDGHAPGLTGADLDAYVAAGIRSDHESTTAAEALDKRRRGMWTLLREASNASNLVDLLEVVRQHGPSWSAFCTDDREPDFLLEHGHMDQMCRLAVRHGIRAEDALLMATLHPALAHNLTRQGALAPAWRANIAVFEDLVSFKARAVWHRGRLVAQDGALTADNASQPAPSWVTETMRIAPFQDEDLLISAPGSTAGVRVIGAREGQLLTDSRSATVPVVDGFARADVDADVCHMAVVERHAASGRIGRSFVQGFGLQSGAFASTVAHDAHNLVVVGADAASMAACVRRLAQIGGGIAVAAGGEIVGELALPVAGLMSERDAGEVAQALEQLTGRLREQGVTIDAPFMVLSFLALSVIPSLKLTDQGLVDVDRFELVDPFAASATLA
jgi:adenine deaminase